MTTQYPEYYKNLQGLVGRFRNEQSDTMAGFAEMHKHAIAGAVNGKTKELIALGMAIAVRCNGCIAYHVNDALRVGATRQEISETIGVAVLMGRGSALMYGAEAVEQVQAAGL